MAEQDGVPPDRIAAVVEELNQRGLVGSEDGERGLTADGRRFAERAIATRKELLIEALGDDSAHRDPTVDDLLHRLARELIGEPPAGPPERAPAAA
jgi:hypothetical protein